MDKVKQGTAEVSNWVGWIFFAGYMMLLAGFFHIIEGLVALFKDTVFVVGSSNVVALDFTQWGWVHLIGGVILIVSAFSVMQGKLWGRLLAVFLATVSALVNFAFMQAYPLWSIMLLIVDVLIIYAVTVHGKELRE